MEFIVNYFNEIYSKLFQWNSIYNIIYMIISIHIFQLHLI